MMMLFASWIVISFIEVSKTEWLSQGLQTATQSSTSHKDNHANIALDLEFNGAYTQAKTVTEPYAWWKVDLTEECIVTQILMVRDLNYNGINGAEIRVGNNDATFTKNPLFAVISATENVMNWPLVYDGDVALFGRYVTIQTQQSGASKQLRLGDVRVFGYRTNRVPNRAYIGCYTDDDSSRALPFHSTSSSDMTIDKCLEFCRSFGDSRFAGMQNGDQCFCGDNYCKYDEAPEAECSSPCVGDPEQSCGGSLRNSVYSFHASGTECYTKTDNKDYRGYVAVTNTGKQCQKWTSQSPQTHTRTPANYPNAGLGDHNFCRNPDNWARAWCYTMDPAVRWEHCDIGDAKCSCSRGSCVAYHTPNYGMTRVQNSNFHFPWPPIPDGVKRISFTIKGTWSAFLILSSSTEVSNSDIIPKIEIGGASNTRSAYLCDSSLDWLDLSNSPNILNPQEDRRFFVAFSDDTVEVGLEEEEPFLIFRSVCPLNIKHLGIASGIGHSADWTFCGYDTSASVGCKGPMSIGWAVHDRSTTDGATNVIMVVPGRPFLCDGVITEWRYWGSRSQGFRAIVWRRIFGKKTEYEVVGINDIPAGASGVEEVHFVPVHKRIHVRKGDMIGFAWTLGVIKYAGGPADGARVRWLSGTPSGLNQGDRITVIGSGIRGYSLKAVVDSDRAINFPSPKGVWPLNTEYKASDLSGHRNHGVSIKATNALYQDATIIDNIKGFMEISGGNDGSCVEIPSNLDLYLSEFTLVAFFRRRIVQSGRRPIVWFDTYDTSTMLVMDAENRFGLRIKTESDFRTIKNGRYVAYNRWTMLTVTYRATVNPHPGSVSVYLDGHLAGVDSDERYDRLRTGSVIKVGNCDGKNTFIGDIAWLQLYDKCLEEDQILRVQRIPNKGPTFTQTLREVHSGHYLQFERLARGCLSNNTNTTVIFESKFFDAKLRCANECIALIDCLAWDWKVQHHSKIAKAKVETHDGHTTNTCRLLKRIPNQSEITVNKECVAYRLKNL